jgi:guanylate kinase
VDRPPPARPKWTSPDRHRLTVLTGPTAVGKGTVEAEIRREYPEVWISVSVTTRLPRPGEVDGVHYSFIDDAEFDELIATGALLEWAVVHKAHRSGTPRRPVEEAMARGDYALVEIDLQGARQVRASMPEALFVFLRPPSWDELVRRLVARGTEDEADQARRLATAREELAAEEWFDVSIVNDDVRRASAELVSWMGLAPASA